VSEVFPQGPFPQTAVKKNNGMQKIYVMTTQS
jgi:hypothetical protein